MFGNRSICGNSAFARLGLTLILVFSLGVSAWASHPDGKPASIASDILLYLPVIMNNWPPYESIGVLDPAFDGDGKVATSFITGNSSASDILIQPDGRLVAAGSAFNGSTDDFAVACYNPDGSLDTTFSGDGKVMTDLAGNVDIGNAIKLQIDGKIVVAGWTRIGTFKDSDDFAVVRYNPDGSLDTSFGSQGKVTTDLTGREDHSHDVVLQNDGKIILAGYADTGYEDADGNGHDFAVVRYNPNGTLDETFGDSGIVITDYNGGYDEGNAVTLQPDGKIVVAGQFSASSLGVMRYNPDGSLDSTFDEDGILRISSITSTAASGYDVLLQPDDKIVVVGEDGGNFAVWRVNPDGSLDTEFSGDGIASTDLPGVYDIGSAAILQKNNKIVAAGVSLNDVFVGDVAVVRYNPDGSLDSSFSEDGMLVTDIAGGDDSASSIVLQPDGKIVVAGVSQIETYRHFLVLRYK